MEGKRLFPGTIEEEILSPGCTHPDGVPETSFGASFDSLSVASRHRHNRWWLEAAKVRGDLLRKYHFYRF